MNENVNEAPYHNSIFSHSCRLPWVRVFSRCLVPVIKSCDLFKCACNGERR